MRFPRRSVAGRTFQVNTLINFGLSIAGPSFLVCVVCVFFGSLAIVAGAVNFRCCSSFLVFGVVLLCGFHWVCEFLAMLYSIRYGINTQGGK